MTLSSAIVKPLVSAAALLSTAQGLALEHLKLGTYGLKAGLVAPDEIAKAPVPTAAEAFSRETIKSLQAFIKKSPDGIASIAIMGDSTMMDFADELTHVTGTMFNTSSLDGPFRVHLSNDRPKSIWTGKGRNFVRPFETWNDTDFLTGPKSSVQSRTAIMRAQAATGVLYGKNCTWGGGIYTSVWADGPLKGLILYQWGFIPEYLDSCWGPCYKEAMQAMQPTAVFWNVGVHLLSKTMDAETCERRYSPSKPFCGDYGQLVKTATMDFLAVVPTVIFKTTNYICDEFERSAKVRQTFVEWQDVDKVEALEKQCAKDCPSFAGLKCRDWLMDSQTSERLHRESMSEIRKLQRKHNNLHVIDAFETTRRCCEKGCDSTKDGVHYHRLDPFLVNMTSAILANAK
mmetsp:Transcript_73666/g.204828  ORF Transcript_73666/g.204828 Transcript_73666/m.204828 type:complete len:401 (+) Transcript_73666:105-1307(+)